MPTEFERVCLKFVGQRGDVTGSRRVSAIRAVSEHLAKRLTRQQEPSH